MSVIEVEVRRKLKRGVDGLTTLEWLLIVAAVAGLAALAVVLVQNVVDDTAEQISGNNARLTAAQVAAEAINNDAETDVEKRSACNRLSITYSDAFQGTPERRSIWTDSNTASPAGDKAGGVCAIVTKIVGDAIAAATAAGMCTTDNKANTTLPGEVPPADRGGKAVAWTVDTDTGTANNQGACTLS